MFTPSEWRDAKAVYVDGATPTTAPGIVPNIGLPFLFPPDSPADSSFTIYTLYDDNNLYVADRLNSRVLEYNNPKARLLPSHTMAPEASR